MPEVALVDFPEKFTFGPKWSLHEILPLLFAGNNLLMKDVTILSPSVAPYLGKLWFTNYI